MKTKKQIAGLFSGGAFEQVTGHLADDIEWNIYENAQVIRGKADLISFCEKVADYFKSVTTKFEMFGMLEEDNRIAIYGKAEFSRGTELVNIVHSCDVYEFDDESKIKKVYSYCNSTKPTQ